MFDEYVKTLRSEVQTLAWSAAVVATDAAVMLGAKVGVKADKKLLITMDEILQNVDKLHGEVDKLFVKTVAPKVSNQQSQDQPHTSPSPKR